MKNPTCHRTAKHKTTLRLRDIRRVSGYKGFDFFLKQKPKFRRMKVTPLSFA
jgi:hypothetical protein